MGTSAQPGTLLMLFVASAFIMLLVLPDIKQLQALQYKACDTNKTLTQIKSVKVSDCDTLDEPCPFVRGFNKSIEIDFQPERAFNQAKVRIAGKIKSLPVPFHVNPDEACGNYIEGCPIEAGKTYKFKMTLPILRTYPKINVGVFVRLVDEKGDIISCIEMPARIEEPQKE